MLDMWHRHTHLPPIRRRLPRPSSHRPPPCRPHLSASPSPPNLQDAMRFPLVGSLVLFSLFLAFKFLPKEMVNAILSGGCWVLGVVPRLLLVVLLGVPLVVLLVVLPKEMVNAILSGGCWGCWVWVWAAGAGCGCGCGASAAAGCAASVRHHLRWVRSVASVSTAMWAPLH